MARSGGVTFWPRRSAEMGTAMLIETTMQNDAIGKLVAENLRLTDQVRKTSEALALLAKAVEAKTPPRRSQ